MNNLIQLEREKTEQLRLQQTPEQLRLQQTTEQLRLQLTPEQLRLQLQILNAKGTLSSI